MFKRPKIAFIISRGLSATTPSQLASSNVLHWFRWGRERECIGGGGHGRSAFTAGARVRTVGRKERSKRIHLGSAPLSTDTMYSSEYISHRELLTFNNYIEVFHFRTKKKRGPLLFPSVTNVGRLSPLRGIAVSRWHTHSDTQRELQSKNF